MGLLAGLTFDRLNPKGKSANPLDQDDFQRAYGAAKEYAREPKGWLCFTGPSGGGKTHLAAAIGNERLKAGEPVFFITAPDLLERLRASFSPGGEMAYDEFFDRVRRAPLLILDDLGTQSSTPWAKEKLDQVITYRFISELPTVVVTSVPLEELDDRIRTRLSDPNLCRVYNICSRKPSLDYGWGPEFVLQRDMTFERFDLRRSNLPREQQENLELVHDAVMSFAKAPEGWLVLMGVNGCGKTHLAAAIVNYRYREKKPALFIVVPEFLDHLRSTFSPESSVSYDELFESVKKTPLLVLDDFGEQSGTPWAQEKLYQVINYRYNSRLSTVITTSKALEEIEDRVSSRLADAGISIVLNIIAPDYRSDRKPGRKPLSSNRKTRHSE